VLCVSNQMLTRHTYRCWYQPAFSLEKRPQGKESVYTACMTAYIHAIQPSYSPCLCCQALMDRVCHGVLSQLQGLEWTLCLPSLVVEVRKAGGHALIG
jgi:hypothetical protein